MPETQAPCDSIVLVHGLWMTPRSWEELRKNPDIIGHSFGGTLTQLLLARGLGVGLRRHQAAGQTHRLSPGS